MRPRFRPTLPRTLSPALRGARLVGLSWFGRGLGCPNELVRQQAGKLLRALSRQMGVVDAHLRVEQHRIGPGVVERKERSRRCLSKTNRRLENERGNYKKRGRANL